jgi:hypothetical protein
VAATADDSGGWAEFAVSSADAARRE